MNYKTLGRTGLRVSCVGLGAAWLDEEKGVETVWAAVEGGCTLIDTAALYGNGKSEEIIARAFVAKPDLAKGVIVTTKVGHWPQGFDYSYDMSMRCVERSMEKLKVKHFPLLYIHDAPKEVFNKVMGKEGTLAALRKLRNEGVVDYIGIAVNDPEHNAPYIETGEFDAAVVPEAYSLLNQVAEERIFPAVKKYNMGVVIATPLEKGLLATGVQSGVKYPARQFSEECLAHVSKIESLCKRYGISLAAAALQFCTRHPLITTTIPGARTPEEARHNAKAGSEQIPEAFWEELKPLVKHWEKGKHR